MSELFTNCIAGCSRGCTVGESFILNFTPYHVVNGPLSTYSESGQQQGVSPAVYAELHRCQAATAAVQISFSILRNLLHKNRQFLPENVG